MKILFSLLVGCFIAFSSFAQYNNVTLKVNGNKNRKVVLDGKTYTMSNTNARANNKNVTIPNLEAGQHTIQVIRNTKATSTAVSSFTIRNGYDVIITVNGTGNVQIKEKLRAATTTSTSNTGMSTTAFNTLLEDVNNQWQAGAKLNMINTAFTNTANFFTASQASQLIRLIDAEASRLQLAKASYRSITDRSNFITVVNLLNSQESKNELSIYVDNFNNPTTPPTTTTGGMSVTNFNNLLKEVQNQWQAGAKQTMINNAFTNTNNYFTAAQARQLIQQVDAETTRLQLAKASYRSIVDLSNFSSVATLLSSDASRNELQVYINSYNSNPGNHAAMNASAFSTLLQNVRNQWQISTKLSMILDAFNGSNYFTASQARQLIQTVDAEASRLQLAKAAYKTITDQSNFSTVSELLDTQASRNDLASYIKNGGEITVTAEMGKTPMTDANFQTVVYNIQTQWLPGSKMMAIQEVFSNTSNYFSTAQVKQLVAFVSVEANRLQLLKSAYRTTTDKNNFSSTYDLLATQAGRDELASYVQSYRD